MATQMKGALTTFLFLGLAWLAIAGFPRLHFAGNFLADTATLNNDPYNFNINAFNASRDPPCYPNYTFPHCNWNPNGSSDFRLFNCFVTKVCYKTGGCSKNDAVVGKRITGSDDTVAAKMTDLDPFFQMYTAQLWGLVVGIEGAFQGKFKTNTVMDVWQRCKAADCCGDPGTSAYWSSVLTDVTWTKGSSGSRFIEQLRYYYHDTSVLNIKFTVDMMHEDPRRPDFALGRVIGTISAVDGNLPEFNRMLWTQNQHQDPTTCRCNTTNTSEYCTHNAPFYIDTANWKVVADFSNSLPTNLKGDLLDKGDLFLVVPRNVSSLPMVGGKITNCGSLLEDCGVNLGRVPFSEPSFLMDDTGIATFALRPLAFNNPLMVVRQEGQECTPILAERLDGLYVGPAEDRVFRMPMPATERALPEPEDTESEDGKVRWSLAVFATQFGYPKAGISLSVQRHTRHNLATGEPVDAIQVEQATAETNPLGIATFDFKTDEEGLDCSRRPHNREHLDGQLYIYSVTLSTDNSFPPDFLTSTHLYCKLDKKNNYTWNEDIYPIFKQYENLYPVMKPLFNLASLEDVIAYRRGLYYAISLPIENPNHMPVTRDLSPAKRDIILEWLKPPIPEPSLNVTVELEDIKRNLRTALMLEWATIPPYLSAYYSIKDGFNNEISRLLKSIIVEEMTHMSMVANILNFIGEAPILNDPELLPTYPGPLPGGVAPDLVVDLQKFSLNVTHDVFMAIETPECHEATLKVHRVLSAIPPRVTLIPDQGVPLQCADVNNEGYCDPLAANIMEKCNETKIDFNNVTIGAIYIHKILCPMIRLYRSNKTVFAPKDQNLKKQVPIPFCVVDICSVIDGIKYIVAQGEGSSPCNPFDGGELSHFYKFAEIWKGRELIETQTDDNAEDKDGPGDTSQQSCQSGACENSTDDQVGFFTPCGNLVCSKNYSFSGNPIPFHAQGVWPTIPNPNSTLYPQGSRVRLLSDSFNQKYTSLMICLHEVFNGSPGQFDQCYALMTSLTVDAKRLVRTPIYSKEHPSHSTLKWCGAPTFEWYPPNYNKKLYNV